MYVMLSKMQIKLIKLKIDVKQLSRILLDSQETAHSLNTISNIILFDIKHWTLSLKVWRKLYPGNWRSNLEHIKETSLIMSERVSSWMLIWLSWFLVSWIRFTSSPTPTSASLGLCGHPRVGNTVWSQQFLEDIKVLHVPKLCLFFLYFFIIHYYCISKFVLIKPDSVTV